MAYDPLTEDSVFGFKENLERGDYSGLAQNIWEGARDEWLGIDDFNRFQKNLKKGNFGKALKSLGAGILELGGTALMFVPGGQAAAFAAKGAKGASAAGKAAKAARGGGRFRELVRPLNLEEQAIQRALLKDAGVKRRLVGAPRATKEQLEQAAETARNEFAEEFRKKAAKRKGSSKTSETVEDVVEDVVEETAKPSVVERIGQARLRSLPVGASRGGVGGSLVRGAGQFSGVLPQSAGPLAARAARARAAGEVPSLGARLGERASGRIGQLAARTGLDTQITDPFLGDVATPPVMPMQAQQLSALDQLSEEELLTILAMLEQGGYLEGGV
jgi:hypothetical protein